MTLPTVSIEVDFEGNPTATLADILAGHDDVAGFWRFNSATTLEDERGVNDGVITGSPASIAGPYPYDSDTGRTFDGSTDDAYVPSSASLSQNSASSIGLWLRFASLPGSTKDVATKRGAWLIQVNSSGKVIGTFKDDTSTGSVTSTTALTTGAWHYVVLVYTDTTIELYIDGTLDTSTSYSSGMGLDGQPIRFAAEQSSASPAFGTFASSTGVSTAPGASKPGSTASGDLLLAQLSWIGAQTVTAVPSGWTAIAAVTSSGTVRTDQVYMKVAGGSEPASYAWTLSASVGWTCAISRFTGVDQTFPIAQVHTASIAAGATPIPTGTHLPNTNNNMVVAMFSRHDGGATFTESSGTERYDVSAATSGTVAMSTQTQTTATSIQVTGTSSTSGNAAAAFMIILNGAGLVYTAVSIDDAAVWNRAVTAEEVAQHYEARLSGEGSWTAIPASETRALTITRGRQYELDRIEASTGTAPVVDLDRDLDPTNEESPYWPNVRPMRAVRAKLTHSSTDYPLLFGYVTRWPVRWVGRNYGEVGLSIVDGFDGLSQAQISGSLSTALSGAQIEEVLDKAYWPADKRNLDAGQYVMLGDDSVTGSALELLRDIADSELGIVFIDAEGNFTFHDRAHRGTQTRSTTVQATFTEDGVGGVRFRSPEPSYDRDLIVNDWAVSPHPDVVGGAEQQVTDPASIAAYWLRSRSRSTRLASNAYALAQANQLLNQTAQPNFRFDSIEIIPRNDSEWQEVLGLEISDRVRVTCEPLPDAEGTEIDREFFLEGIAWSLAPQNMRVTLQLSPVSSGDYYHTILRDGPVSYWRMDTAS